MVRGGHAAYLHATPEMAPSGGFKARRTGTIGPTAIGIVISCKPPNYPQLTYVVFSEPSCSGWVDDGQLRKL